MPIKNIFRSIIGLSALLLVQAPAFAATPPPAMVCESCHGTAGLGTPNLSPMLAGMDKDYLVEQINHFKNGNRKNPLMSAMAMTLATPEAVEQVATFFASLPAPVINDIEKRGDNVIITDPARKLVYQGDWSRNIPACATCHGPSGLGVAHFPRLASQHADYITSQLTAWQSKQRSGDHNNVMATIAQQLTASEIQHLAQYFAAIK
ncbi:c-type cytochrome [Moritella marina ATCC 15381]|uniref:C-type cytochrome n=1 Tax=Moritella marina ATCC 15381 TaxID=1202962 RepID=A0A5J6WMS4_MORMI|nr:c-type cytochrome [Moritella marina]QFI39429.1 c-type cytochrome [Moritella marina ATCC 15381]